MGSASIKRYELGGSSPDPAQIGIYKILKSNPSNIRQFFLQNKGNLTTKELKVVTDKIFPFLNSSNEQGMTIERFLETIYKEHEDTWATVNLMPKN